MKVTDGTNTQPAGDAAARAVYQKITDGYEVAEVTAASTAAVAGDLALVVALSPNSPVPSGTNAIGTVTAVQPTAASLNVTAVQGTATNLNATVSQPTASNLNALVSQPTAGNLNATVVQPTAANLNATSSQGSPTSLASAWPVKVTDGVHTQPTGDVVGRAGFEQLTDGTNGPVAVKASGQAAQTTDPSLAVALSPNSPLPSGTNTLGTVNVGTTGGLALDATLTGGSQKTRLTDGTSTVAVKAASTATVATDPALVVGLSPNSPLPAGTNALGTVTANIGTTGGLAMDATLTGGTLKSRVTDGTNTVAVKPASTTAGVSDPSLVVGLSPNSPLPAGTNSIGSVTAVQPTAASLNAQVSQPTAANLNATTTQGPAAALSGGWPVKVTDGTNTLPTGDVAGRAIFQKVTDGTNGPVAVNTAGADGVSNTETVLSTVAKHLGFNGTTWDRLRSGITAVGTAITGFLNTIPWGMYNVSPTTRTDGQGGPLQTDASGNLLVSVSPTASTPKVVHLDSRSTGFSQRVDQIGDGLVQEATLLVTGPFVGSSLDTMFWSSTGSSGSGGVTVSGGQASVATGATANSVAVLQSVWLALKSTAHPNALRALVVTPDTGTANNVRRIGVWNGTDGFGFVINGASGSGNLGVFFQKAGGAFTDTYILNGNGGSSINWTANINVLEVEYLIGGQYFYLNGVLIHTNLATSSSPVANFNLPIRITNTNSNGSTTNVSISILEAAIRRYGNPLGVAIYKHIAGAGTNVLKTSPGTLYTLLVGNPAGTVSIYDNATGGTSNPISILTLSGAGGAVTSLDFGALGLGFQNGLTLITSSGSVDLTAVYE